MTWMAVGLVTTLATASVLDYNAQLRHAVAQTPVVEPAAPATASAGTPDAKVDRSAELSDSPAGARRLQRTN